MSLLFRSVPHHFMFHELLQKTNSSAAPCVVLTLLFLAACALAIKSRPLPSPLPSAAHFLLISLFLTCQDSNLNAGSLIYVAYCQSMQITFPFDGTKTWTTPFMFQCAQQADICFSLVCKSGKKKRALQGTAALRHSLLVAQDCDLCSNEKGVERE